MFKTTTPKFTPKAHFYKKIPPEKFFLTEFFSASSAWPFPFGHFVSTSQIIYPIIHSTSKCFAGCPDKNKEQQNTHMMSFEQKPAVSDMNLRQVVRSPQFGYFAFHSPFPQTANQRSVYDLKRMHSGSGVFCIDETDVKSSIACKKENVCRGNPGQDSLAFQ